MTETDFDARARDERTARLALDLADAFVRHEGGRPIAELRQFTELMLRLIPEVDVFTRAVLSQRLAPAADLPLPILLRLAGDEDFAVAEPVLAHAPALPDDLVDMLARDADVAIRRIIARRPGLAATQIELLLAARDPEITALLAHRLGQAAAVMRAETRPAPRDAPEEAVAFLAMDRAGRAERIAALTRGAAERPAPAEAALVTGLVRHATLRRTDLVFETVGAVLGLSAGTVRTLFDDDGGEPQVVLLAALGLPEEAMAQLLARTAPHVGEVVDQMFRLRAVYRTLDAAACAALIADFAAGMPAPRPSREPAVAAGRAVGEAAPARRPARVSGARSVGDQAL